MTTSDSYTDRKLKAATVVENMREKITEIAAHMDGKVDHKRDDTYTDWLSSSIYMPNGMAIFFRNNNGSESKPVFTIGFDLNISAKNGAIWDRMAHLTDRNSENIYSSYRAFEGTSSINVSALKPSDRIAKEIKSRLLTADAEAGFNQQLDRWIASETQVYNSTHALKRIASSCKSQYPINLDRIGSESFSFSCEASKYTKVRSTHGGQFNLELHFLSEDELMQILRITNRLK